MSVYFVALLVPLGGAFLIFVMPLWLWLHYRHGRAGLSQADRQAIASLTSTAERLEARLAAVERSVVDAETSSYDMKV